jgi:hypothetical protein
LPYQLKYLIPQAVPHTIPVATNYTLPDRTLSFQEIYGRPMVIVRKKLTEVSQSPRVQLYLDQTADVGEYLLNPIQFPVVIERKDNVLKNVLQAKDPFNHTALQFPLLGRGSSEISDQLKKNLLNIFRPNWLPNLRSARLQEN